jgi:hypothetical protein
MTGASDDFFDSTDFSAEWLATRIRLRRLYEDPLAPMLIYMQRGCSRRLSPARVGGLSSRHWCFSRWNIIFYL